MQHISFSPNGKFKVALLIKEAHLAKQPLIDYYISHLDTKEVVAFSLNYFNKKKPPADGQKEYLAELMPHLERLGITHILCADSNYFKTLTKLQKVEANYGYELECKFQMDSEIKVLGIPNYYAAFFDPKVGDKIRFCLDTFNLISQGEYTVLGEGIIHSAAYPSSYEDIEKALEELHKYPMLACDIEAFSLKHHSAGIGTIAFAWDKHNGMAICLDYQSVEPHEIEVWDKKDKKYKTKTAYGTKGDCPELRGLLRRFFERYEGRLIFHRAAYDVTVLVYQLWMKDLLDQVGLHKGLDILAPMIHDTLLITYLTTNSCAGNKLKLKEQAHAFAGNYAQSEIKNIRLIKLAPLLEYNLVDVLSTFYLFDKRYPTLATEGQLELYQGYFLEWLRDIIQMQLTGMCLDIEKVKHADRELCKIRDASIEDLHATDCADKFIKLMRQREMEEYNTTRRVKRITLDDTKFNTINPNSGPQMQTLLYTVMGLPVIDKTKSDQPAVGGETLEKLKNHTDDPDYQKVLDALIEYALTAKIITSFIGVFLEAPIGPDGFHYLFGNFNLGGTVSGRLSASDPNLQTIPSGSKYAKLIKACFISATGWVFCGADFASLEDKISALTTSDPAKLKVYIDDYDGHCLRTHAYFGNKMPDIILAEEKEECFKLTINGTVVYAKGSESVVLNNGTQMSVSDYYNSS